MLHVLERDGAIVIVGGMQATNDDGLSSKFTQGGMLTAESMPREIRVLIEHAPDQYPDYFELQQVPIVSSRFLAALDQAGVDNVISIPVSIEEDAGTKAGYFILHIVGRVACLDEERARVTRLGRSIARIKSLSLKPVSAEAPAIFRLHEQHHLIIVNDRVKAAVSQLDGAIVSPAEGWSDQHQF